MMKLIFLDFDGVINIPLWDNEGKNCRFYSSADGKVNDFQAICWLNELCRKTDAKIVLSTSWSIYKSVDFLRELLYNSGLDRQIEVVSKIPHFRIENYYRERTEEIQAYLNEHLNEGIESFVILDDDEIFEPLNNNWVKCILDYGFKEPEMKKALSILNRDY